MMAHALREAGHEVAIYAFYGLEGAMIGWGPEGSIPIYPNPEQDWGAKHIEKFYDDHKADLCISLVDVWVLRDMPPTIKWFPWTPVDHEPIPPRVRDTLQQTPALMRPIAMSRFGQAEMEGHGIDCFYAPHSVDARLFFPRPENREFGRKVNGWEDDLFVIGMVGTNVRERKNWTAAYIALQKFVKRHPNTLMYCHTDRAEPRGRDLEALRDALGIRDHTRFPSQAAMQIGISAEEMVNMYNALDIFLLPSKGEGFGIPLIEAQACGVPVITSNHTACKELGQFGWLLRDLRPQFTEQSSWEGDANPDEIDEYLEEAWQMWAADSDAWAEKKAAALAQGQRYNAEHIFYEYWLPMLAEMETLITQPRNLEGAKASDWRRFLIPKEVSPAKLIDIGCGKRQVWKPALEALGEYVGVDQIDAPGVVKADAARLPYKRHEFGFAWSSNLLEHVDNPKAVLKEAKRVAHHGAFTFTSPASRDFPLDPGHKDVKGIDYRLSQDGMGYIIW
jgi:hypothetical protein